ncbi:NG,NG-dimethylarginine dimethylaminohydrolase 1 [Minicystis rosea]|nr:NG,NG-dimethylarginine dimethylaminohydrolase 1 [Minicystis rosea]
MDAIDLYLMSPPAPTWRLRGRANFRSEAAAPVDARAAIREWVGLADAIEARGGRVVCLVPPPDTELTGLPYAAECGQVVERDGELVFLLPNMFAPHRVRERDLWRPVVASLGLRPIDLPAGLWEAQGDVAELRGRTLLFFGGRTDRAGLDAVRPWFPADAIVLECKQPAFHGNMAALPLETVGKILVCPEVIAGDGVAQLERAFGADALVPVSVDEIRLYATNGLPVGRDVLAPHLTPLRIVDLMRSWGLGVTLLPMRELCEKAGGASRCLVSRARVPAAQITIGAEVDYRKQRDRILAGA